MKTDLKLSLLVASVALFACGKTNPNANVGTFAGNGRANRAVEEISGNPYLISTYIYIDGDDKSPTGDKDVTTAKVGYYAQVRVYIETAKKSPTIQAVSNQVKAPPVPPSKGAVVRPPTKPTAPAIRTLHYFLEEYASCSDTTKAVLINKANVTKTISFTKGAPIVIPDVGTLTIAKAAKQPVKTGTLVLDKALRPDNTSGKSFTLNRWHSRLELSDLNNRQTTLPAVPSGDTDLKKVIQGVAQSCEKVTALYVKSIVPDDVNESDAAKQDALSVDDQPDQKS
jgi:hypothetical protein